MPMSEIFFIYTENIFHRSFFQYYNNNFDYYTFFLLIIYNYTTFSSDLQRGQSSNNCRYYTEKPANNFDYSNLDKTWEQSDTNMCSNLLLFGGRKCNNQNYC